MLPEPINPHQDRLFRATYGIPYSLYLKLVCSLPRTDKHERDLKWTLLFIKTNPTNAELNILTSTNVITVMSGVKRTVGLLYEIARREGFGVSFFS